MKHLSLTKPHLIIMVGIPGSGKSFFAEKFAETFGAPYVSDQKIAKLVHGDIGAVTQLQLDELLKTKQSIVFDGASDTRVDRMTLTKKAKIAGYESMFIWVQTDPATSKTRATQGKKGESGSLTDDNYDKLFKKFTPPNATEKPLVISGKHTYASQAKVVLKKLSAPRAEIAGHEKPPLRPERPKGRIVIR